VTDEPEGFDTPEEAARGDIPAEHFRVLGVRIRGNQATVWSLTNDGPPFEWYTDFPVKEDGRWQGGSGSNSFGTQPHDPEPVPREIWEEAARLSGTNLSAKPSTRLEALLYELCADYGYCLTPPEQLALFFEPPRDADAFVDAVLLAEGLNPNAIEKQARAALTDVVRDWLFDEGRGKGTKSGLL
jgi:hypothetical protein